MHDRGDVEQLESRLREPLPIGSGGRCENDARRVENRGRARDPPESRVSSSSASPASTGGTILPRCGGCCDHEAPGILLTRVLRKPSFGPFPKFFADRGPHLAAMIAYFALVSFVPLTFLALALLGLAHRVDESSYLVTELQRLFPSRSIDDIVATVRRSSGTRPPSGSSAASSSLWSSLSLFSALESAFNIVYDRAEPARSSAES